MSNQNERTRNDDAQCGMNVNEQCGTATPDGRGPRKLNLFNANKCRRLVGVLNVVNEPPKFNTLCATMSFNSRQK